MIIFSLIKTNYLRNNGLFKNKSTQSKGNRIVKMGKLFLTNSLSFIISRCVFGRPLFCKKGPLSINAIFRLKTAAHVSIQSLFWSTMVDNAAF
jgi:hypothetical protein